MYLHLGSDISVNIKYIIAIFDLDNTSTSKITQEFLSHSTKRGQVINVSQEDLPKSYVLYEEKGKVSLYVSPISSRTLYKRAKSGGGLI